MDQVRAGREPALASEGGARSHTTSTSLRPDPSSEPAPVSGGQVNRPANANEHRHCRVPRLRRALETRGDDVHDDCQLNAIPTQV